MLYHVSDKPNLEILTARIPEIGVEENEDMTIKRVCFSNSISGCLSSIGPCKDMLYYVYIPIDKNIPIYKPTVYDVRDSEFTGEIWSFQDVEVKLVGIINTKFEIFSEYETVRGTVRIPNYTYKWIEGGD